MRLKMLIDLLKKCIGLFLIAITGCIIYIIVYAVAYAIAKDKRRRGNE